MIADEELPAPIRFLPQYDNLFLSHDDRSRILVGNITIEELAWRGGVLIDGYVSAAWRIRREKKAATMTVTLVVPVTGEERAEIEAEGERLLTFLPGDVAARHLQIVPGDATTG